MGGAPPDSVAMSEPTASPPIRSFPPAYFSFPYSSPLIPTRRVFTFMRSLFPWYSPLNRLATARVAVSASSGPTFTYRTFFGDAL